jgi:microcin C transport system permease protein
MDYFVRRILLVIPTFIGITLLCFLITQFIPGGPVEQIIMQMKGSYIGSVPHSYCHTTLS